MPEQQTDFVFTVAGEELGFVGAAAIILLLGRDLVASAAASPATPTDLFGRSSRRASSRWFAFQAFENIGMTLGHHAGDRLPLPFVSYGGSSMFATWMPSGCCRPST